MGRGKLTPQEEAIKPIIADNIKKYLNLKGKKPIDLQRGTKIAQSTISDYTSGKTLPNAGNVQKIADFFGVLKSDIDPRFSSNVNSESESEKTEVIKFPIDLAEIANADDDAVYNKLVSAGGRPLTDKDKAMIKLLFADRWEELTQKAKDLDNDKQ